MEPHQGDFIVETADQMLAWAAERHIEVRGEREREREQRVLSDEIASQVTPYCGTKFTTTPAGPGPCHHQTSLLPSSNTWTTLWSISLAWESGTGTL